jgi:hypothetical protein
MYDHLEFVREISKLKSEKKIWIIDDTSSLLQTKELFKDKFWVFVQIKGLQVMENQRFLRDILYHKPRPQWKEKQVKMVWNSRRRKAGSRARKLELGKSKNSLEIRAGEEDVRVRKGLRLGSQKSYGKFAQANQRRRLREERRIWREVLYWKIKASRA